MSNFSTFEISFVILFPPMGTEFKNWNLLLLKNKALVLSYPISKNIIFFLLSILFL